MLNADTCMVRMSECPKSNSILGGEERNFGTPNPPLYPANLFIMNLDVVERILQPLMDHRKTNFIGSGLTGVGLTVVLGNCILKAQGTLHSLMKVNICVAELQFWLTSCAKWLGASASELKTPRLKSHAASYAYKKRS